MATPYIEGFERGNMAPWVPSNATYAYVVHRDDVSSINASFKPLLVGNYGLAVRGSSYYVTLNMSDIGEASGTDEFYLRYRYQTQTPADSNFLFTVLNSISQFICYADSSISVGGTFFKGQDYAYLGWMPVPFRWSLVEIYCKFASDDLAYDGRLHVWFNGISVIADDTFRTNDLNGVQMMDNIRLYGTNSNSYWRIYDDVVFIAGSDATSFANIQTNSSIVTYRPSSNGSDNNWQSSPLARPSYKCVDEIGTTAVADGDYIQALGTGGQESYNLTSDTTGNAVASINSIQSVHRTRKLGPSPFKIKPYVKSGGQDHYGNLKDLDTDFNPYQYVWLTDPGTGTFWDSTSLINMELGVESDE